MIDIRFLSIVVLSILVGISGCRPGMVEVTSETDEKQYQLAKDYKSQGRTADALRAFLRVTEARRNAPESHLESGNIYLNTMNDPISAIYHFKKYLQSKPNSPQARQVRQLIETAQKKFAQQLPAQPYEGEWNRMDLMELINGLKQENNRLRRELAATQQRLQNSTSRSNDADFDASTQPQNVYQSNRPATISPNPSSVPRVYTVQSGDSLSSISRSMYGTPSRWIDIYQANRDRLSSENALRVGQELRIP